MTVRLRHVALVVPDLRPAETYYQTIFSADLIGREARLADGLWYTMRPEHNWDDADNGSIDIGMVALRKDEMVLALFAGGAETAQPLFIGLAMEPAEIALVRSRLPQGTEVTADTASGLAFRDRYGVRWQLSDDATPFRTAGEIGQRWLELG